MAEEALPATPFKALCSKIALCSSKTWTCPGSKANHMAPIPDLATRSGSARRLMSVDKTEGS